MYYHEITLPKTLPQRLYLTEREAELLYAVWKFQEHHGGQGLTGDQLVLQLLAAQDSASLPAEAESSKTNSSQMILKRKLSLVRKLICELNRKGRYITTLGWSTDTDGRRTKLYGIEEMVMVRRPYTAKVVLALPEYCAQQDTNQVSTREFRKFLENTCGMSPKQLKEDIAYAISMKYFLVYHESYLGTAKRIELERPFLSLIARESSSLLPEISPLEMTGPIAKIIVAIWQEERENGGNSVSISKLKERTGYSEISIRNHLAGFREEWPWRILDLVSNGCYKLALPMLGKEGVVGFPETAMLLTRFHEVDKTQKDRVTKEEILLHFGPGTDYNYQDSWIEDSIRYAVDNLYLSEVDSDKNLWPSNRIDAERPYLEVIAEQKVTRLPRPSKEAWTILDSNGQPKVDTAKAFPILDELASKVLYALALAELHGNFRQLDRNSIEKIVNNSDRPDAGSAEFMNGSITSIASDVKKVSKAKIDHALQQLRRYPIRILNLGPEETYSLMVDTSVSWPCGAYILMQILAKIGRGNLIPYSAVKRVVPERHYRTNSEADALGSIDEFHSIDLDVEYLIRTRYLEARDLKEFPIPYTQDFSIEKVSYLCVPPFHNRIASERLYLEALSKHFQVPK